MWAAFLAISGVLWAEDAALKPFVLAYRGAGTMDTKLVEVKAAVEREGFQVVGEYTPYKGTHIIVVTSEALKKNATNSRFGAYGAALRISITEKGKDLQVSYINPLYMAQAYRMKDGLADTASKNGEGPRQEGNVRVKKRSQCRQTAQLPLYDVNAVFY